MVRLVFLALPVLVLADCNAAPVPQRADLKPPLLDHPQDIMLQTGRTVTKLDPGRDYRIILPRGPKIGSTMILGGHNIVMIGGNITVPPDDKTKRALYIKGATGTVHIEGVLIDNPAKAEFDAIAIAAPAATVQLKNIRVEGVRGFMHSWHADILQPWGGVKSLIVDGLTGTSAYQGIQLSSLKGPIGTISLRNVNLRSIDPQIGTRGVNGGNGGYLFWADCSLTARIDFDQVYVAPRPERLRSEAVWPASGGKSRCGSRLGADGRVTFPALPITGEIRLGSPPRDFVPAGMAGLDYRPTPQSAQ